MNDMKFIETLKQKRKACDYSQEKSPQFHEKVMERLEHQQEREQAFLSQSRNCFAIYQVSRDDPQNVRSASSHRRTALPLPAAGQPPRRRTAHSPASINSLPARRRD